MKKIKSRKFLFIIDPIENLNLNTDTTIEIMNECSKQNIEIYYATLEDLFFHRKHVFACSKKIEMINKQYLIIDSVIETLDYFNLILMRKEPPYDLNYHYATMLLEKSKTPVINNSQSLRDANEKLVILNFPSVIPETLVSKDVDHIKEFIKSQSKVVLKPIDLFGGKGITTTTKSDKKQTQKVNKLTNKGKDYILVQKFLPEVYKGDKRILLLNGNYLGGIIRKPKKGDFRANMAVGGQPTKLTLTASDKKVIKEVAPYLKKKGLDFVGIDIVKDKLIEINVTCPTGLVPVNDLDQKNNTKKVVALLKKKAK